ncbi:MAG: exodeoxyribonuclease III [Alphaproteobacteria bacterium]|nr:exodeoxyribonuclease III [Alphaproteobacteria bacterium]
MDDGSQNSLKPPPSANAAEDGHIRVCTWNVNSVKVRLPALTAYLQDKNPDFMMLQEIKTETASFPAFELNGLGYYSLAQGQKSYNGVALLSKHKIELIADTLPGAPDNGEQARFIEAYCPALKTRLISVYVPNGEPPATDPDSSYRLEYKLAWLDALIAYAHRLMNQDDPFIIGGDFNVIEYDDDVYDPSVFKGSAFTILPVRQRFRSFYYTGLTNALRRMKKEAPVYSYWDYRAGAWEKNNGILLDHLFLSPTWADTLSAAAIDSGTRGGEKASDHAPVRCDLSLQ